MSPENQWLEDVFSYWNSPFLGDMSVFRGVPRLKKGHTRSHIPRVFKTKRSLKPRVHDAHVGPAASQSAHSWPGMYVFSKKKNWLVVATHLKNMIVKMGSSSPTQGWKFQTYLKPPDRYGSSLILMTFQVLPSDLFVFFLSDVFRGSWWPPIWAIKRSLGRSWLMDFQTISCLLDFCLFSGIFFWTILFCVTNIFCEHILHSDHCSSTRSAMPWNPRE